MYEVACTTLSIPHPYADAIAEAWIVTHAAGVARREMAAFALLRTDARPSGAETPLAPVPVSTSTAEHYSWGDGCDRWHLVHTTVLSVIHERMPRGARELRHWHTRAHQYFHVIDGELTLEVDGATHRWSGGAGLEIGRGTPHQAINLSTAPVNFLVTSHPPGHGDRIIDNSDGEWHG